MFLPFNSSLNEYARDTSRAIKLLPLCHHSESEHRIPLSILVLITKAKDMVQICIQRTWQVDLSTAAPCRAAKQVSPGFRDQGNENQKPEELCSLGLQHTLLRGKISQSQFSWK
ncbi:hypothetical protein CEXT_706631 [Caerostris extrusa]|uniref:Uncharacterized protein n=1 Tax=Caerostris extrusa TaxID=172846 RepID=A0AAV4RN55_CAEEX|nr:hypothetical protein CEXT_706631 [Caerostris extrusa]